MVGLAANPGMAVLPIWLNRNILIESIVCLMKFSSAI